MDLAFRTIAGKLWEEYRTLIGGAAGYTRYESGNEVSPHLPFGRIYGFDESDAEQIQCAFVKCFGCNGVSPPRPLVDEIVGDYVVRATIWLHRHDIGAEEALDVLRAWNEGEIG